MALIGFTVFREKILSGQKRQTIRRLRKRPVRVGETLHLYWKLRTKKCRKLIDATCTETFYIRFTRPFLNEWAVQKWLVPHGDESNESKDWRWMSDLEVEDLARRDGFNNSSQMITALMMMHDSLLNLVFQVIRW